MKTEVNSDQTIKVIFPDGQFVVLGFSEIIAENGLRGTKRNPVKLRDLRKAAVTSAISRTEKARSTLGTGAIL